MDSFDPAMFPDSITLKPKLRPTSTGKRGGVQPSWSEPGTALSAYVELLYSSVQRPDAEQAQPKSVRTYRVFTASDSGARIDDHVTWQGRTLAVREPSVIQGPLWMFEAIDVE